MRDPQSPGFPVMHQPHTRGSTEASGHQAASHQSPTVISLGQGWVPYYFMALQTFLCGLILRILWALFAFPWSPSQTPLLGLWGHSCERPSREPASSMSPTRPPLSTSHSRDQQRLLPHKSPARQQWMTSPVSYNQLPPGSTRTGEKD